MLLQFKMWAIVRIKWLWLVWAVHLMKKYQNESMMHPSQRKSHALYLWNNWNKGFPPRMRFTPMQVLNVSYYQDALLQGDFLPDGEDGPLQ